MGGEGDATQFKCAAAMDHTEDHIGDHTEDHTEARAIGHTIGHRERYGEEYGGGEGEDPMVVPMEEHESGAHEDWVRGGAFGDARNGRDVGGVYRAEDGEAKDESEGEREDMDEGGVG